MCCVLMAENDIAARRCRECDTVLVDPDDMLKAALRLKDALVLRCSGMSLQHEHDEKGEWLKITYYDEDGADVSERFRLQTPAQRTAFEQLFIRPHTRTPGIPLPYATWWIRQTIERAIMNQTRTIRLPIHIVKELNVYLRTARELSHKLDHEPSAEEIAEQLDKPVDDVSRMLRLNERITSVDRAALSCLESPSGMRSGSHRPHD